MKLIDTRTFCLATALLWVGPCDPGACAQEGKPENLNDRVSYSYGVVVARDLKERGIPINVDVFMKGFDAINKGGESLMSETEISRTFDEIQLRMDEENAQGEDKENLMAGKAFLEKNAKKEGVKTGEQGLQFEIIKEGDGPKPTVEDTVTVQYTGSLIDGTVFDSSVERNEPFTCRLTEVGVLGWARGVPLMPVGSKYPFIPYYLAYGDAGAGDVIKPYSTLIFEIELLEIKKPQ